MGENSKIEWTHHTFNPWRGCTKVSEGCKFCYAEKMSGRNPSTLGVWGSRGLRVPAADSYWRQLAKWNREAERAGERRRVFVASLADIAERDETMPEWSRRIVAEARERLWNEIESCSSLDFLLLTKRPDHLGELLAARWPNSLPPNIWAGTSVENQAAAGERVPHLLSIPAEVRFVSCEPLLGPVDLHAVEMGDGDTLGIGLFSHHHGNGIDLVIAGGESGPKARPMHPAWARSLRDQCVAASVPFFFKQWGEWVPGEIVEQVSGTLPTATWLDDEWDYGRESLAETEGHIDDEPDLYRIGKRSAGRLLDGREWSEVPNV